MIELDVEDYCEKCPDFNPVKNSYYAENHPEFTLIQCEHIERCRLIAARILRTKNNSNNEKNS